MEDFEVKTGNPKSRFEAKLLRPAKPDGDACWAFVILPGAASDTLPRRGRTSIDGTINGAPFRAMLEPDGNLGHWLRIDAAMMAAAGAEFGDVAVFEVAPVDEEPEPEVPDDLRDALAASHEARVVWEDTTTLARVDWIHWIVSAKQAATRRKRVDEACDKLASGQRRVCCFDPSGHYSKAFKPPKAAG
ncbi:YdeI/OmpD-associated family protein [Lysobacter brunescens]|uniref:YdeI/OmpD-associated family protein n=1 Tax=Lysobacter brunescens TaxID=262323 RepID=A0ABW2YFD9_9GAMM